MVRVFLLWFLIFFAAVVVSIGVALAAFSRELARQNRVDPDSPCFAPMFWLWSPGQAARLHRRLRAAARSVYVAPPAPVSRRRRRRTSEPPYTSPADELCRDLVTQARVLDEHLVVSARYPRPTRRQQLRGLQPQVIEVERLATRLLQHRQRVNTPAGLPGTASPPPESPAALATLADQLDNLDQAHNELFAIEQANGLMDPDLILRQISPQPAPAYAPRGSTSSDQRLLPPPSDVPPARPPAP